MIRDSSGLTISPGVLWVLIHSQELSHSDSNVYMLSEGGCEVDRTDHKHSLRLSEETIKQNSQVLPLTKIEWYWQGDLIQQEV